MALADLIVDACTARPQPLVAVRHEGSWGSACKPQRFTCDDGALYSVKFIQNRHGDGRGAFNEQVVALCGELIGAPVPPVRLVEMPSALTDVMNRNPAAYLLDFTPQPGIHHGSKWMDDCSDRAGVEHVDENRQRLGSLEVLYTWLVCRSDHQLIYSNKSPREVYSVDHTTFLPGEFNWNAASLLPEYATVVPDTSFQGKGLTDADRSPALDRLRQVTEGEVAVVVSRPPDEWGVSSADRLALAEYVLARRDSVLNHYQPTTTT